MTPMEKYLDDAGYMGKLFSAQENLQEKPQEVFIVIRQEYDAEGGKDTTLAACRTLDAAMKAAVEDFDKYQQTRIETRLDQVSGTDIWDLKQRWESPHDSTKHGWLSTQYYIQRMEVK